MEPSPQTSPSFYLWSRVTLCCRSAASPPPPPPRRGGTVSCLPTPFAFLLTLTAEAPTKAMNSDDDIEGIILNLNGAEGIIS